MDNDLERSVRLLEDALSTPTKGLFKRNITPLACKSMKFDPNNISIMLDAQELRKLQHTRRSNIYNETFGPSVIGSILEQDKTMTGSIIQNGHPWANTMDNLFSEFADIVQGSTGGADMLEAAADLARCCSDALTVIQGLKSKVAVAPVSEEKWLESERNNWRLLYVIYQDRLQHSNMDEFSDVYEGVSEKECVEHLFKRDNLVRESQLVIDWLERNALEKNDPILSQADWTCGWEHTLHQLLAPDSIAIGSSTEIVTCLHPDVVGLEEKPLHHLDASNEKQLLRRIFTEIRCGRLQEAQQLCLNCGHPWRAAMLAGWKLFHNPNVKSKRNGGQQDVELSPALTQDEGIGSSEMEEDAAELNYPEGQRKSEGNASRDLWKAMAQTFCKLPNLDRFEKASIATLCGWLQDMLPVCATWEDNLWAYMRTMVDIRVESEIRDNINRTYQPLPEQYWGQRMSLNEVFAKIEASDSSAIRNESLERDHIIQKHIILDEIPKLIEMVAVWTDDLNISTQSLRFFAHLVLFLRNMGEVADKKNCEAIVEAYILRLCEMNETQLVAFYVSQLGRQKQVLIYAAHLEKMLDNDDRRSALAYAEDLSLDVFAITKRIVDCIRNRPGNADMSATLSNNKVSEDDEIKISALDWLIFYEDQRVEAITQTNALIFNFLTLGKLDAAHLALGKIPPNSVDRIISEGEIGDDVSQVIKEFLSYKAYLDAQEAFNEWFTQFRNKPLPPSSLPDNAQFTEKVAHQHRVSQFNAETERWKLTTSHAAKSAKTLLYNVLLFPEGWLSGGEDTDYLRSLCIPEVVLLLYSILYESGNHEEAVQLADLIASEKHGLHKIYHKEKLGELLEKLCESSVALLNAKKDPWGNPATA